jgi:hypothetical protein
LWLLAIFIGGAADNSNQSSSAHSHPDEAIADLVETDD